jgi:hypothetical protein
VDFAVVLLLGLVDQDSRPYCIRGLLRSPSTTSITSTALVQVR